MYPPRKTKKQPLTVSAIAKLVVLGVALAAMGLSYVNLTTQIQRRGAEIGRLEHDLASLQTQRDVVDAQIETRSSRVAIRQKLDAGIVKMIPIAEASIVRVNSAALRPGSNELRVVSNQEISR